MQRTLKAMNYQLRVKRVIWLSSNGGFPTILTLEGDIIILLFYIKYLDS